MTNRQEARVTLMIAQLNKLKPPTKNKTETILRLNKKNIENEKLLHELFPATRQTTKIRNAFAKNMPEDIKLKKAQMAKIIKPGGPLILG